MSKFNIVRVFQRCLTTDDLDEDLIPIDKNTWLNKLDYFKKKLGLKKSKKTLTGKDIVFKCLLELFAEDDAGIDLKILEQF